MKIPNTDGWEALVKAPPTPEETAGIRLLKEKIAPHTDRIVLGVFRNLEAAVLDSRATEVDSIRDHLKALRRSENAPAEIAQYQKGWNDLLDLLLKGLESRADNYRKAKPRGA